MFILEKTRILESSERWRDSATTQRGVAGLRTPDYRQLSTPQDGVLEAFRGQLRAWF